MHRQRLFKAYIILLSLVASLLLAPARPLYAAPPQDGEIVLDDDVTLREGEHVKGDLMMMGGNLIMRTGSRVEGGVTVFGGDVTIDGLIEGDLIALGGDITLQAHARVKGDVVALGGHVHQAEGARTGEVVKGLTLRSVRELRVTPFSSETDLRSWNTVGSVVATLAGAVLMALLGMAVVNFWPAQTTQVGKTIITLPLPSLGVGCLLYPLAGGLTLFLLVTLCLAPFAPVVVLLLVAASLFGWVALGTLWGRWLVRRLGWRRMTPLLVVGVGVFSLTMGMVVAGAVPCLGPLLILSASGIGLGAVTLSRFGTSRPGRS